MAAIESTGTSNGIKEQYEKQKKWLEGVFYFPPPKKGEIKAMKTEEKRKK